MWTMGAYAHALGMLTSALNSRRHTLPGGRPFALLLGSLAVSSCGDWLYNVALLAFVYQRTGSATWVAITTAARVIPMVVIGPLGGVAADRHDRRRLIIASDLSRGALMVALAAVAAAGLPIVLAPVLAAAATAAGAVQPPCVAACTARFVDEHELPRASALRATVGQTAIVVGPALGAIVLVASSPSIAILLNALTFFASAIAIKAIAPGRAFAPPARETNAPTPSLVGDLKTGALALRGAPVAVRLLAADVLCSAVYGVLTVTLVLASLRLGVGGGGYGVLLGAVGVGGVIGASLAGRAGAPAYWRRTLAVSLLVVSVGLATLGALPTLAGALAGAALAGGGMVVSEVLSDATLPTMLADDVLARAYGLAMPTSLGGIVAGSMVAGPLVSLLGLQGALTITGLAVLSAAALLARPRSATVASVAEARVPAL
jgi:MFS family permease